MDLENITFQFVKYKRYLLDSFPIFGILIFFIVFFIVSCNRYITQHVRGRLFFDIPSIPYNRVGLLLGTSKYSREGGKNDFYHLRIKAAAQLYFANKIKFILISGDNSSIYYNEPTIIYKDLIEMGVPPKSLYRDFDGFRTLDSVIRAKQVFKLNSVTIISQGYHNKRAVYIAMKQGMNAVAFNAGDNQQIDFINRMREALAKTLAFIEVSILDIKPVVSTPPISIGELTK